VLSEATILIAVDDPRGADVRDLIAESDAYMQRLYPAESNHLVDADALSSPSAVFLTARDDSDLLGSIAYLVIAPDHAEMKRMFVRERARGVGLGRMLLRAMENEARSRSIHRISLETGIRQPEAVDLYRAYGYQDCGPFGSYQPDPLSLFMTKRL